MTVLDSSGKTLIETTAKPDQGTSDDLAKQLEDLKAEGEKNKTLIETLTAKYADVEEQNRNLGKIKKQLEGWQERVKSDPSKVLEELGGDPLVVGTQVLGDLDPNNKPDEPPDWFKTYAEKQDQKLQTILDRDEKQQEQGQHFQRFGQLRAFMAQEGAAEKYPFVAMNGDAGLEIIANKMRDREEHDGYAPTPAQMLEEQNKFMDEWNSQTTKMWAKNKIAAKRMLEALQEEGGYSIHGASPRLTLMNEDDGVSGGEVDTSKLTGDALIRHNMALADAATEGGK